MGSYFFLAPANGWLPRSTASAGRPTSMQRAGMFYVEMPFISESRLSSICNKQKDNPQLPVLAEKGFYEKRLLRAYWVPETGA